MKIFKDLIFRSQTLFNEIYWLKMIPRGGGTFVPTFISSMVGSEYFLELNN